MDSGCEERSDTHKAVGAVDLFVPFFPLDRAAVARVIESHLRERAALKRANGELRKLTWHPDAIDFLVSQVEFEREHSIEGGKEAPAVLSRWVTRALRRLIQSEASSAETLSSATADCRQTASGQTAALVSAEVCMVKQSDSPAGEGTPLRDAHVYVAVADDGKELVARVVPPP